MFITVIPFFTEDLAVNSYMFLSQQSKNLMTASQGAFKLDGALSLPELDFLNLIGLSALTSNMPIFVPVQKVTLIAEIEKQCVVDPSKVIFLIDDKVPMEPMYLDRIEYLREACGFRFAIRNVTDLPRYVTLIGKMDYIIMNDSNGLSQAKIFLNYQFPKIKIIVSNVNDNDRFEQVKKGKFYLYEGAFYRVPVTKGNNEISPLKINYVQLINIANDENFELTSVSDIVQQDIALVISLLTLVNNLGLASEVTSIRHASAILGQNELRKWITTAVVSLLCSDKPTELTRLSLLRAKFMEAIAPQFEMAVHANDLFMVGLFSVVDIALQLPMEQALEALKVSKTIADPLLHGKGKYVLVLDFIKQYEAANWQEVSRLAILYNMNVRKISDAYLTSMQWYSSLLNALAT